MKVQIEKLWLHQEIDPKEIGKKHTGDIIVYKSRKSEYIVLSNGHHRIFEAYSKGKREIEVKEDFPALGGLVREELLLPFPEWFEREKKRISL